MPRVAYIIRIIVWFGMLLLCCIGASAQNGDSITLSDAVLHYSVQGQGQPVLFLSGGPGVSSDQLSGISSRLSSAFRCILFDQRGTGKSHTSPFDSTTINLRQSMEDITLLLRHLDIGKITIVGHSWGAMLAMSYAINNPQKVSRLVLIGPGPLDMSGYALVEDNITSRSSRAEKIFMKEAEDSISQGTASKELLREYNKTFTSHLFYDALRADSLMAAIKASLNNRITDLMLQDLARIRYDVKSGLSGLEIPMLVVCGRQDPVGLFSTILIKDLNKNARICWIEKSGHFPWVEEPEPFYAELLSFLK